MDLLAEFSSEYNFHEKPRKLEACLNCPFCLASKTWHYCSYWQAALGASTAEDRLSALKDSQWNLLFPPALFLGVLRRKIKAQACLARRGFSSLVCARRRRWWAGIEHLWGAGRPLQGGLHRSRFLPSCLKRTDIWDNPQGSISGSLTKFWSRAI